MKPEPLRGKKHNASLTDKPFYIFNEEDCVSAVEFYIRYKGGVTNQKGIYLLKTEQSYVYELYFQHLRDKHNSLGGWVVDIYNDWLFNYCFGDVI